MAFIPLLFGFIFRWRAICWPRALGRLVRHEHVACADDDFSLEQEDDFSRRWQKVRMLDA